ncbi:MAG: hypothetical protein NT069_25360 [Planctomycetota bacterium]|nr:hypothetical protein [Planctomycetota bacterium]
MTFGILAFVIVASLFTMGLWFMVSGVADGFAGVFAERPWIGKILTGLLLVTT